MMEKYKDIINLPHHVSLNHKPMDKINRAAQFAPFAALVGYEDAINEKGRTVDKKIILTNEEKEKISNILSYINLNIKDEIKVSISYSIKEGIIRRIDEVNKEIIFKDKTKIKINDIYEIKGELDIEY